MTHSPQTLSQFAELQIKAPATLQEVSEAILQVESKKVSRKTSPCRNVLVHVSVFVWRFNEWISVTCRWTRCVLVCTGKVKPYFCAVCLLSLCVTILVRGFPLGLLFLHKVVCKQRSWYDVNTVVSGADDYKMVCSPTLFSCHENLSHAARELKVAHVNIMVFC